MCYLEKCYQKDPNIVFRRIADEVILVPIRQDVADMESIYTLNEVGSFIWEIIESQRSVTQIKELIIAEFEVDPETAEFDLIEFLVQLEAAGGLEELK